MSASPMTEEQGDKVISLLRDLLWELKNGGIVTNVESVASDVNQMQTDLTSILTDVSSMEKRKT